MIFNRALSEREIKQLYKITSSPPVASRLKEGLVLHYSFDKEEGVQVTDKSEKENHGKIHGAKWTAKGKRGGAYEFDGKSSYIDCGNPRPEWSDKITVSAWVRPGASDAKDDYSTIVTKVHTFYFQLIRSARLAVHQGGTSPDKYHTSTSTITPGQWHHVAYTYDGSRVTIYVNGALDSVAPVEKVRAGAYKNHLGIGMNLTADGKPYFDSSRPFAGMIDEVMLYNRALSNEDIKQLYSLQK